MQGCDWWNVTLGTHRYPTIPSQYLQQYRVAPPVKTKQTNKQKIQKKPPKNKDKPHHVLIYSRFNELGLLKEDHEHLLKLTLATFLLQIFLWTKQIFLFLLSRIETQRSRVQNLIDTQCREDVCFGQGPSSQSECCLSSSNALPWNPQMILNRN